MDVAVPSPTLRNIANDSCLFDLDLYSGVVGQTGVLAKDAEKPMAWDNFLGRFGIIQLDMVEKPGMEKMLPLID